MIEPGTRVGGYVLERCIGQGGVGQIWRAHADQESAQSLHALKLLKPLDDSTKRRDFYREVYALAQLRHANIAHVSDVGVWRHDKERYPFLVMDYIEGETFKALANKKVSWKVWYPLILDVLHALAHAHATGVIHRDIKPSNILVELDERGQRMARIVDFGVARVVNYRPGETELGMTVNHNKGDGVTISGTPRYMAPEQIDPRCGVMGPWTDLYAVGCMLWRLLCLRGPFDGELYHILASQLTRDPGPFEPVIDVPDGLESWLRWLMSKNPYTRCRHAEHAAATFASLRQSRKNTSQVKAVQNWDNDETSTGHERPSLEQLRAMLAAEAAPGKLHDIKPTLPAQWDARTARQSLTSGDALVHPIIWRHRPRPMVGRREERDLLWARLSKTVTEGCSGWVTLSGGAGVGKSHLQQWFERYVRELGVAQVLSLSCTHLRQAKSVAVELIRRFMWFKGVDADLLRAEWMRFFESLGLSQELARLESAQFAALLAHECKGGAHEIQDHEELLMRFLGYLSANSPVVLSLHGLAHHPSLAEKLVSYFGSVSCVNLPLLIVTVSPEPEALDVKKTRSLGDRYQRIVLSPLPQALQCRALSRMLPLDQGSLQMLVSRTQEDLPLAVLHLRRWVHEGMFARKEGEFELDASTLDGIASSHHDFWVRWLDELEHSVGDEQLATMELAALMGETVHEHLWRECCDVSGYEVSSLFERLLDGGVIQMIERGRWKFAQAIPHELFRRRAYDQGRGKEHHEVLARVLETCEHDDPIFAERAMEQWLKAQRYGQALHRGCLAGERYVSRSDFKGLERIIEGLSVVANHSRPQRERAQVYASLFSMVKARHYKRLDEARERGALCMAMARLNGWSDIRARVQLELAVLAEYQGRYREAFELLEHAEPSLCARDKVMDYHEGVLARRLLRYKAHVLIAMRRHVKAIHVLDQLEQEVALKGSHEHALVMMTRARCSIHQGEQNQALRLVREAILVFERTGDRRSLTMAMNTYADLVMSDEPEQASQILKRVLSLLSDDPLLMVNTKLRLSLVSIRLHDYGTADVLLQDILEQLSPDEHAVQVLVSRLARAICAWSRGHKTLTLSLVSQVREMLYTFKVWDAHAVNLLDDLSGLVGPSHAMLYASLLDCRARLSKLGEELSNASEGG